MIVTNKKISPNKSSPSIEKVKIRPRAKNRELNIYIKSIITS